MPASYQSLDFIGRVLGNVLTKVQNRVLRDGSTALWESVGDAAVGLSADFSSFIIWPEYNDTPAVVPVTPGTLTDFKNNVLPAIETHTEIALAYVQTYDRIIVERLLGAALLAASGKKDDIRVEPEPEKPASLIEALATARQHLIEFVERYMTSATPAGQA